MHSYLLESNVGMYGMTHVRHWNYPSHGRSGSLTTGPADLPFCERGRFVATVERPEQYPLWVAFGEPTAGISGLWEHRHHMLAIVGYWLAAGARVTWPRSLPASQRRYWASVGAEHYRRANLRQWQRSDERAPERPAELG